MSGGAPKVGEVIPYWFLWRSEHEAGEESGRKPRPCVVVAMFKSETGETRIAVLPVTHTPPDATRSAIEIPPAVKAHLMLDAAPSWIMCDEFNEFDWPGFDVGKTPAGASSFGLLPRGLIDAVRAEAAAARARGAFKTIPRDK